MYRTVRSFSDLMLNLGCWLRTTPTILWFYDWHVVDSSVLAKLPFYWVGSLALMVAVVIQCSWSTDWDIINCTVPTAEVNDVMFCCWWSSVRGRETDLVPSRGCWWYCLFFLTEILNLPLSSFCTWSQLKYAHLTTMAVQGSGSVYECI